MRCAHADRLNAIAEQPMPVTTTAMTTIPVISPKPSNPAITAEPAPIVITCTRINANVSNPRVTSPVPISHTDHANAVTTVIASPKFISSRAPVSRKSPSTASTTAIITARRGFLRYRRAVRAGVNTTKGPCVRLAFDVDLGAITTF